MNYESMRFAGGSSVFFAQRRDELKKVMMPLQCIVDGCLGLHMVLISPPLGLTTRTINTPASFE